MDKRQGYRGAMHRIRLFYTWIRARINEPFSGENTLSNGHNENVVVYKIVFSIHVVPCINWDYPCHTNWKMNREHNHGIIAA